VGQGQGSEFGPEFIKAGQNEIQGPNQPQGQGGIQDIGGSQAVVKKPGRRADLFLDGGDESQNIVPRFLFQGRYTACVHPGLGPNPGRRLRWNQPLGSLGFGHGQFHFQPGSILAFQGPQVFKGRP
jgi:hypothetical protein